MALGRPLMGFSHRGSVGGHCEMTPTSLRRSSMYRGLHVAAKAQRGETSDLHRVPCPEPVFLFLLSLGEQTSTVDDLMWVGLFVLQLLGWLRGDSVAGLTAGDVVQADDLSLTMSAYIRPYKDVFPYSRFLAVGGGRRAAGGGCG